MKTLGTLLISLLLASTTWAVPITFTHTFHDANGIEGSLDGVVFSTTDFTITATGDTSARQSQAADIFFIDHTSAQIDILGVGTFTFVTGTRTFVNQGSERVGFSRAGAGGLDLYNQGNAVYSGYDLLSSIGPIAADFGEVQQWTTSPVVTNAGVLVFESTFTEFGTFQAVVRQVPATEPGLLGLLALGLLAVRRRSQKA